MVFKKKCEELKYYINEIHKHSEKFVKELEEAEEREQLKDGENHSLAYWCAKNMYSFLGRYIKNVTEHVKEK